MTGAAGASRAAPPQAGRRRPHAHRPPGARGEAGVPQGGLCLPASRRQCHVRAGPAPRARDPGGSAGGPAAGCLSSPCRKWSCRSEPPLPRYGSEGVSAWAWPAGAGVPTGAHAALRRLSSFRMSYGARNPRLARGAGGAAQHMPGSSSLLRILGRAD